MEWIMKIEYHRYNTNLLCIIENNFWVTFNNRHLLSDENVKTVVHSIVSSRLDYCNSLFHGIDKKSMNKLQKLQNAAARIISKRKKRESVRDVLVKLHWLPVENRIVYKILVLTFKIVHNLSPKNLSDLLSYRCQHTLTFNLCYFDSKFGRQSFSYAAPRYWNALPVELRFLNNLDTFKKISKHICLTISQSSNQKHLFIISDYFYCLSYVCVCIYVCVCVRARVCV